MEKKIVLTGGGTAGHVNPNIAIIPLLRQKGYALSYIGSKDGIEKELIPGIADLSYYGISSGKLRRYFSFKNFSDPFRILKGYAQSKKILKQIKPDLLFSKGGYVSVPVVFAAHKLKIPIVIHESDYSSGLANRLSIPKAKRVCCSFEATVLEVGKKAVLTGSPVRKELALGSREKGLRFLDFSGEKPVLLIMGGSLGALAVNMAVEKVLEELLIKFDVCHIRGKEKINPALEGMEGYRQLEFVSKELPDVFAATDLMISRAGANTIFEILTLCIPALLIPLPLEAGPGRLQILNAKHFEKWAIPKCSFRRI